MQDGITLPPSVLYTSTYVYKFVVERLNFKFVK